MIVRVLSVMELLRPTIVRLLLTLGLASLGAAMPLSAHAGTNWAICDVQVKPKPSVQSRLKACTAILASGKAQAKMNVTQTMAAVHYDLDETYLELKRYRESLNEYNAALPVFLGDPAFRSLLGVAHKGRAMANYNLGQFSDAEADLEQFVQSWGLPSASPAENEGQTAWVRDAVSDVFGNIYIGEGRFQDAVDAFNRFLTKWTSATREEKEAAVAGLSQARALLDGGQVGRRPPPIDACIKFPDLC